MAHVLNRLSPALFPYTTSPARAAEHRHHGLLTLARHLLDIQGDAPDGEEADEEGRDDRDREASEPSQTAGPAEAPSSEAPTSPDTSPSDIPPQLMLVRCLPCAPAQRTRVCHKHVGLTGLFHLRLPSHPRRVQPSTRATQNQLRPSASTLDEISNARDKVMLEASLQLRSTHTSVCAAWAHLQRRVH